MTARPEDLILADYDAALAAHGDNAAGALWPNEAGRLARFDVMLDLVGRDASQPAVLCDLACGTGELVAHLRRRGMAHVTYRGIDRSELALAHARRKFPGETFMTDAFWEPMTDAEIQEWEGGDVFPARVAERPAEYGTPGSRKLKGKRRS